MGQFWDSFGTIAVLLRRLAYLSMLILLTAQRRGCAHTRRRRQDRGAFVAAVCPAESQSTRHRATAAALRSIVDGYRATVGAAIDTDTIDRHRDSADGGEIAARRYD